MVAHSARHRHDIIVRLVRIFRHGASSRQASFGGKAIVTRNEAKRGSLMARFARHRANVINGAIEFCKVPTHK